MGLRSSASRLLMVFGGILFSLLLIECGFRVAYHDSPMGIPEWMMANPGSHDEPTRFFTQDELLRIPDSVVFLGASSLAGTYPLEKEELVYSILENEYGIATIHHPMDTSASAGLVPPAKVAAPLHPKAVVIYFGHNDEAHITFEFIRHPGSSQLVEIVPAGGGPPSTIDNIEAFIVRKSYLLYWLYARSPALRQRVRWYPHMPAGDYQSLLDLSSTVTRWNLLQVICTLEQEGVPLVIMTVLSNIQTDYGDMRVRDTKAECGGTIYLDNGTRISSCELMGKGNLALAQGNREEGLWLLRNGAAYAKIGGYNPFGATPHVNSMIRELAEEHGLILVDTEKHFDELFIRGEVEYGCDMFGNPEKGFCDGLHPNAYTHRVMAELLAPVLRELVESDDKAEA